MMKFLEQIVYIDQEHTPILEQYVSLIESSRSGFQGTCPIRSLYEDIFGGDLTAFWYIHGHLSTSRIKLASWPQFFLPIIRWWSSFRLDSVVKQYIDVGDSTKNTSGPGFTKGLKQKIVTTLREKS